MKIPECNLRNIALLALGLWTLVIAELYAGAWVLHVMPPNAWFAFPTFFAYVVVFIATVLGAVGTTAFLLEEAAR